MHLYKTVILCLMLTACTEYSKDERTFAHQTSMTVV